MGEFIKVTKDGAVAHVTFAREKGLNILATPVLAELEAAWDDLEKSGVRVAILHGDGKVFVAGADIKEMAALDPAGAVKFAQNGQRVFAKIEQSAVVSIAAMHGAALGGGCELALACDIRIAATGLKIGQPEVNLGLIPGFGGSQRLPRVVGEGPALYMILSGNFLSAEDALRIGLVTQVTSPEELLAEAKKLAETIAQKGPGAVRTAKRLVLDAFSKPRAEGLAAEAVAFGESYKTGEAQEGLAAFVEKRAPKFKA